MNTHRCHTSSWWPWPVEKALIRRHHLSRVARNENIQRPTFVTIGPPSNCPDCWTHERRAQKRIVASYGFPPRNIARRRTRNRVYGISCSWTTLSCEYTANYEVTSPLRQRTDLQTEDIGRDTVAASRSPLITVMLLSPGQKHNTYRSIHSNFFRCLTLTLTLTLFSNCFVRQMALSSNVVLVFSARWFQR